MFEHHSRNMLVLVGTIVLFCSSARFVGTSVERLPVIDKQDIRFARLSVDGEPFRKWVLAIAQDNYGFMWFGTDDGLYRYDGYSLRSYRHDPDNPRSLSDNTVKAIYKDRVGILWIGTGFGGLDRLDPVQDTITHYRHDPKDSRSLSDDRVNCIYEDRTGSLWVGTDGGPNRLDVAGGGFFHYEFAPEDHARSRSVTALYEDSQGNFWVCTTRGLNRLERSSGRISPYPNAATSAPDYVNGVKEDSAGVLWVTSPMGTGLSSLDAKTGELKRYAFNSAEPGSPSFNGVSRLREDRNGALWLSTLHEGLLKFDKGRKSFVRYSTDIRNSTDPSRLYPGSVGSLFEDSEGNMWVGSPEGLCRFQTNRLPVVNYQHEAGNRNSLHDNAVWSVYADGREFLWIGTQDGLHRLNRKTGQVVFYQHDPKDPHSLSLNVVSAIVEDGAGGLWIGTQGGGLNRFDRASGQFVAYRHNPMDPHSLSSDLVQRLLVDPEGVLWVGTRDGGLNRFDRATGRFKSYRHNLQDSHSLSEDNVREIFADRTGILWIGTNHGLNRFDRGSDSFTVYLHNPYDLASLSHDCIGSIFEDRQGTLWIGTLSGLDRLDRVRGTFVTFTIRDGLADDTIEAIREDARGNLWLATHEGLSKFHPQTKTVRNYSEADGSPGDFVNPTGTDRSCVTPEGEMVFGSQYGVTVFNPDRLSENSYVPPVVLTDLLLFNRPVIPANHSPIQQPIWAARSVTLNQKQGIFTLEFAALSYSAPQRNRYRYRLEPLESDWNEVDSKRRVATYTGLPPGNYVFRVQGSNNDLVWNEAGVRLDIAVLPPWWGTWWFRTIACFGVAGLVFVGYRTRVRSLRLVASSLELQVTQRTHELQIAKDSAEAANRAKSTFLANMSHELRTPLNAILGFANLLRDSTISDKDRRDLEIINSSGKHLLKLINGVLDIAKAESGRTRILFEPCNPRRIASEVMEMMRIRASEKHLTLHLVDSPAFPGSVKTDGAKLRQVLTNLVGNGVLYTKKGSVTLRLDARPADDGQRVLILFDVEDTGVGIAAEDQSRIFDAFAQVGKHRTQKGTGLGLTITQQLVELMGGTIRVESAPGEGSRFRIELPVERAEEWEVKPLETGGERLISLEPGQREYRVLIVEDKTENWLLLRRMLDKAGFHSRVAADGKRGVEMFKNWRPDFIWMDLRMPVMDGREATRRIRALEGGRDVKIAIVTASAFASERDEVLAEGVDDFVLKPYRPSEIFNCMARLLGVKFRSNGAVRAPAESAMVVRPEDLRALPDELRAELANAVVILDIDRIKALATRVSERDAMLGQTLTFCAERYALSEIYRALIRCDTERARAQESGSST